MVFISEGVLMRSAALFVVVWGISEVGAIFEEGEIVAEIFLDGVIVAEFEEMDAVDCSK